MFRPVCTFLLIAALLLATPLWAAQISLIGMQKQERISSTRITLEFSALPQFEMHHSAQRLDLLLADSLVSPKLRSLPEDEQVVKILLAQKHRELMVSYLLRRPPVQVLAESADKPPRVVIDLYWQKDEGNARPAVAFRIAGMPARRPGKDVSAYDRQSPWEGRWPEFFRDYRTPWKLAPLLNYQLPPLPPLISDQQSPLWPLQQLAAENKWLSLIQRSSQLKPQSDTEAEQLQLLLAEAQLRTGATESAAFRLDQLRQKQSVEQVRVDYLTAAAQALGGQPIVAYLNLQPLLEALPGDHPLAAAVALLAAESSLASQRDQQALDVLSRGDRLWPAELLPLLDQRRADALAGLGELDAAIAIYSELAAAPGAFDGNPFSCNRAAASAFEVGEYTLAAKLYQTLAVLLKGQPGVDLALYGLGAAAYDGGDGDWGVIHLQKAVLDQPGTEGGNRAELRLIDHRLLSGGDLGMAQAASEYEQIATQAGSRAVREEATFKRALALYLLGDHAESVQVLMRFRREYASSSLRRETDLLLLEQLPTVVHRLLERQDELAAVVLVEQNRNLLLSGGVDADFLHNLAGAFERLGLYDRSGRVLLYLFDAAKEPQRQLLYLPLARSYLKRGEFAAASSYASRYLDAYPRGKDAGALFGVLLDAFSQQGRDEEMIAWLNRKDRPSSPELEVRAAWIYWQQERPEQVISSLERARLGGGKLAVKEMALLGEAYYSLKKNAPALKLFEALHEDAGFGPQARYRSAQLLLRERQRKDALNLLTQLVEEQGTGPWQKLARDLLIQETGRNL